MKSLNYSCLTAQHLFYTLDTSETIRKRTSSSFTSPIHPAKRRYPRRLVHNEDYKPRARKTILHDDDGLHPASSTSSHASVPLNGNRRHYQRVISDCWKESEVKALVEFILFHSSEKWPPHHNKKFWESEAAEFIEMRTLSLTNQAKKKIQDRFYTTRAFIIQRLA